jgi:hypothetical protein
MAQLFCGDSRVAQPLENDVPEDLPRWLWLWTPLFLYFGHYLAWALLAPQTYNHWFPSETGFTENVTVVFAAIAMLLGLLVMRRTLQAGQHWLTWWFLLFVLGCLYFGGEEASWGQQWFHWQTPESWAQLNDQGESNFHNTDGPLGSLLDQLPRNLLTLGALIAGGIMPWLRHARSKNLSLEGRAFWLLPSLVCVPTGLLAGLGSLPEKLQEKLAGEGPIWIDIQSGEVKELLLAFFLLLYAASVLKRWRQSRV